MPFINTDGREVDNGPDCSALMRAVRNYYRGVGDAEALVGATLIEIVCKHTVRSGSYLLFIGVVEGQSLNQGRTAGPTGIYELCSESLMRN